MFHFLFSCWLKISFCFSLSFFFFWLNFWNRPTVRGCPTESLQQDITCVCVRYFVICHLFLATFDLFSFLSFLFYICIYSIFCCCCCCCCCCCSLEPLSLMDRGGGRGGEERGFISEVHFRFNRLETGGWMHQWSGRDPSRAGPHGRHRRRRRRRFNCY